MIQLIILITLYSDLQDELDTAEKENEYEEWGNQVIGAGFTDISATMEEVMKARIAQIYSLPVGSISILNYTVSDCLSEVEIDEDLADSVREGYNAAASAALIGSATFWTEFKEKCTLKLGRLQVGQKLSAWSSSAKNWFVKTKKQTCTKVRGLTKAFQKLALGDKLKAGWNKFTNSTKSLLTKVTTGTAKFVKNSFGALGSVYKRAFRIGLFVIGGVILILVLLVIFNKGNFGIDAMIPI